MFETNYLLKNPEREMKYKYEAFAKKNKWQLKWMWKMKEEYQEKIKSRYGCEATEENSSF